MKRYGDDWQTQARKLYDRKNQGTRFKLAEGDNSVRILPGRYPDGKFGGAPFVEHRAHPQVGPNSRFITCGKDEYGQGECWLCDVQIPKMLKSNNRAVRIRAQRMAPVTQFVMQVAYLDSSGSFVGPLLWSVPSGGPRSLATQILGILMRTKRNWIHPVKGFNLNISRTGTGFRDTRYGAVIPDDEPSSVPASIIKQVKPMEELLKPYDLDAMQAAYFGREDNGGYGSGGSGVRADFEDEDAGTSWDVDDLDSDGKDEPKAAAAPPANDSGDFDDADFWDDEG